MSRPTVFLVSCAVALIGATATASSAPAQPPNDASCLGVLSSFAGQAGTRDLFAPAPGQAVARLAQAHGDLAYCLDLFFNG